MVGTFVTSVTANDVDEGTILEYSIEMEYNDGQEISDNHFSIDSRTGAIHLVKRLDREKFGEIALKIRVGEKFERFLDVFLLFEAWDGKYWAETTLVIDVIDENDNAPIFSQQLYETPIPSSISIGEVVTVLSAVDYDFSKEFSTITYSIHDPTGFFVIDSKSGNSEKLYNCEGNKSGIITLGKELSEKEKSTNHTGFLIAVRAEDQGLPRRVSHAALHITFNDKINIRQPQFESDFYNFTLSENMALNLPIGSFGVSGIEREKTKSPSLPLYFRILDLNAQKFFNIDRFGSLWLRNSLINSKKRIFEFPVDVSTGWRDTSTGNSTCHVTIHVFDENNHSPIFQSIDRLKIPFHEDFLDGHLLTKLSVIDEDVGENGKITMRIVAGEEVGRVRLDESGSLVWNGGDNKDPPVGSLVIMASDFGTPSRNTLLEIPFSVDVSKWSQTAPFFVLPQYRKHVREGHSALGRLGSQAIAQIRAINRLGLNVSSLQYSLKDQASSFSIDPLTGEITSLEPLDYEKQQIHTMSVSVTDSTGRSAVTPVEIIVLPVDEFPPLFLKSSYTFSISLDSEPGTDIGEISAIDGDSGDDGIVKYRIEEKPESKREKNFGIDPFTGLIRLTSKLDVSRNGTIETLVVIAESGPLQRSRSTVFIEIGGSTMVGPRDRLGSPLMWSIWAAIGVLLVLLLVLLILCVYRHKTRIKQIDSPRKQVYAVSRGQVAVMANVSRDSPLKSRLPPKFPASSSMSSSNSEAQNIRSSAISSREFFTTRSQPDSGIDQDTVSLTSSVNEYLQSLGVNIPPKNKSTINQRPLGHSRDGDSLIYARLEDIVKADPSPVVHRSHLQSFSGGGHRSASPPNFQPLTEIFAEIERLQREPRDPQIPHKTSTTSARFVDI